jgi:2-polyprenyl-6-methoxyphenol hydroxylase-like FAD-dependent oxidoreductase
VVHRADLHRVLLDALRPGTVRYGVRAAGVSAAGTDVQVDADPGGSVERFDLVVAADGIRSGVRAGWPGDPGVRYAGYAAWRGVTSGAVDVRGEAGETWGRGLRFGIAPLGDGRVYWFAVATLPAGSPLGDGHARVTRTFGGWHAPIAEVVAATPPSAVTGLEVHHLAGPVPTFRRGRCVLLGDAAHAMTPDLGQGANQALEDAATLVRLTAGLAPDDRPGAGALDAALDAYDRLRRPRTQRIARQARLLGAIAQARGPVTGRLRDTVVRLVPDGVAARQSIRLQSWRPPAAAAARARGNAR